MTKTKELNTEVINNEKVLPEITEENINASKTDLGTYSHSQAFMVMEYEDEDKKETKTIWNSRDGAVPHQVIISGKTYTHNNIEADYFTNNISDIKEGDLIFTGTSDSPVLAIFKGIFDDTISCERI
jgi:hypothetical protein